MPAWVFGWSSVDKRLDFLTDATGTTRYVYAPDLVRQDGSENKEALGDLCRRHKLDPSVFGTIMRSPDDIPEHAISFIFSPNRYHDDHLEALLKTPHIEAVYVEKPMAIDGQELQRVDKIIQSNNKKVYFGDHYLFAGIGLFALMGKHIPYKNLLVISSELRKLVESAKRLLGNIIKIEARNVFIGHENLIERRSWLEKRSQGGGVLLDLQVHLSNVFHALGFEVERLIHVECQVRPPELDYRGGAKNPTLGRYRQPEKGEDLAEDRAFMQGRTTSGASFEFEVAQFAAPKDEANYFQITDDEGKKLKLYFANRKVQYLNKDNKVISEIEQKADVVLLMMHHALSYFYSSDDNEPILYHEQRASINFIEQVKSFCYDSKSA